MIDAREWISVKDRLPEHDETILIWHTTFGIMIDTFDLDSYTENGGNGSGLQGVNINDVTHWMPLPEPPKQ